MNAFDGMIDDEKETYELCRLIIKKAQLCQELMGDRTAKFTRPPVKKKEPVVTAKKAPAERKKPVRL